MLLYYGGLFIDLVCIGLCMWMISVAKCLLRYSSRVCILGLGVFLAKKMFIMVARVLGITQF
jgi:hypothetical protein